MRKKLISRDKQTLSYLDIGPKSDATPVCILVHGFGMQASFWLPLVLPLTSQYRFILPDLRGFGGSINAQHTNDHVFETFADDLNDLITELGLYDVALAGYSMGGMTSVMYQRRHGTGRLKSYLQIDQSPVVKNTADWPWGLYGAEQVQAFADCGEMYALINERGSPENWSSLSSIARAKVRENIAHFVAGTFSRTIDKQGILALHAVGLTKPIVNQYNWPAYLRCMRQYTEQQTDLRDVFEDYDIALWVFAGEKSELYSVHGQYALTELVRDSRLIEFEDDGHALPFESPIKFIRSLSAFISMPITEPATEAILCS